MNKKILGSTRGAAMVEFAIVLLFLVPLFLSIIDFSVFLYNQAVITNASREGARFAASYYVNPANSVVNPANPGARRPTCAQIGDYLAGYVNDLLVKFTSPDFTSSNVECPDDTPYRDYSGNIGYLDTIRIRYRHNCLIYGSLDLNAVTVMRDENQN